MTIKHSHEDGTSHAIIRCIGPGYRDCLKHPLLIMSMIMLLCAAALYFVKDFTFDASADTLISRSDPELAFFRKTAKQFGDSPFLVMTYTPFEGELLTEKHIARLKTFEAKLLQVDGVISVAQRICRPESC